MANENLSNAKNAKKDEFYTQYNVIEKEISAYLEYDHDIFRMTRNGATSPNILPRILKGMDSRN